jgi:hypothetical protein
MIPLTVSGEIIGASGVAPRTGASADSRVMTGEVVH